MKIFFNQKISKGVKKEKNKIIHLWLLIVLLIPMSLFSNNSEAYSLETIITKQITKEEKQRIEKIELSYNKDRQFLLAQIEWENDWWEEFRVSRNDNKNVSWLTINEPPTDQAILSAKFIDLRGFNNSLLEVYGLTHTSHGFFYVYEIKDNALKLLFKIEAVDFNPDIRWAPENYKKYGYGECGEIFAGGKLMSEYKDINKDGNFDLVLSGVKEIICEKRDENFENSVKVKVDSAKIEMKFLWDKNKHTWVL